MKLCFDTVDELRAFVKDELKGRRGGKAGDDNDTTTGTTAGQPGQGAAPPPMMPPQGGPGGPQFQPPQTAAFQPSGGFPGAGGAPGLDPAVAGLVGRINAKIDGAISGGQPADAVLTWFRGQCGGEAANATMDQIKQHFLPKLPVPSLENIAKLMNA